MSGLGTQAQALSGSLQSFSGVANAANGVLDALEKQLASLNTLIAPIANKAVPLMWAESNVASATTATDQLLEALAVSRKVNKGLLGSERAMQSTRPVAHLLADSPSAWLLPAG
jgi:ABC-type transporter Mla subunit MlaD